MKVNKTLFMFFAVITISFYLNIQPTRAQSITSASMGSMGMDTNMDDDDQYWQGVEGKPFEFTGQTRTYYLGADEVVWDFVPDGYNKINGTAFEGNALTYTQNGPERIGSKYLKCLYRAYTSDKFDELQPRPEDEEYLGFLGPIIRAEVGDIIKVVFRNGCRIPASVHPHGVFYGKADEGAPYNDGTPKSEKYDDVVHPGDTYTYTWEVPERAGPNSGDGSSVMWMYHSHTTEIADVYAGLSGPMAITRKGKARADGSPKDVNREIFMIFEIIDENQSPYLDVNFAKYAQCPAGTPAPVDDEDFQESNLKHSINGHIFGNGPLITINKGERVRWYLMSMGTEDDLHTPHWHGNVVTISMMRMDMVSLLPAEMIVADMVPDNEGIWLFHCHVGDHIKAGMLARYQVNAD